MAEMKVAYLVGKLEVLWVVVRVAKLVIDWVGQTVAWWAAWTEEM